MASNDVDDADDCSSIVRAVRGNDLVALKQLIDDGQSVNDSDSRGWGPLHEASALGHLKCLGELLRQRIIDLNARTSRGQTAVFLAVQNNKFSALRMLLKKGANPNIWDNDRVSPLNCGQSKCVQFLLESKILNRKEMFKEACNKTGNVMMNPLECAISNMPTSDAKEKIIRMLLQQENCSKRILWEAAILAVKLGDVESLHQLYDDLAFQDRPGTSSVTDKESQAEEAKSYRDLAIFIASKLGSMDCVTFLFGYGANILDHTNLLYNPGTHCNYAIQIAQELKFYIQINKYLLQNTPDDGQPNDYFPSSCDIYLNNVQNQRDLFERTSFDLPKLLLEKRRKNVINSRCILLTAHLDLKILDKDLDQCKHLIDWGASMHRLEYDSYSNSNPVEKALYGSSHVHEEIFSYMLELRIAKYLASLPQVDILQLVAKTSMNTNPRLFEMLMQHVAYIALPGNCQLNIFKSSQNLQHGSHFKCMVVGPDINVEWNFDRKSETVVYLLKQIFLYGGHGTVSERFIVELLQDVWDTFSLEMRNEVDELLCLVREPFSLLNSSAMVVARRVQKNNPGLYKEKLHELVDMRNVRAFVDKSKEEVTEQDCKCCNDFLYDKVYNRQRYIFSRLHQANQNLT